jgi:DNA/RNA-binding domain of Phe-tRNA-synthetase-like protein
MACIDFTDDIKVKIPKLQLGCIQCDLKIEPASADLLEHISTTLAKIESTLQVAEINKIPTIQSSRKGYKTLGKEPSRYRLSAEALLRRVVKGKGLYHINNAVDALNLVSAKTGYSIGGYDVDKIDGTISLGIGKTNEPYEAIGRGQLNIEFLPLFRDQKGAFGSPTSDSVRTMVTPDTKRFLMLFFNFGGHDSLAETLTETIALFEKYVGAKNCQTWIEA